VRRRNRKKNVNAFILPIPIAGLVIVLVTLCIGYVMLMCRRQTLGGELAELERQRTELLKQHEQELFKWTCLKAPENLERALRLRGIAMTWPSNRQIVRMRRHSNSPDSAELDVAPRVARLERLNE
jgi:hypothetical protein